MTGQYGLILTGDKQLYENVTSLSIHVLCSARTNPDTAANGSMQVKPTRS